MAKVILILALLSLAFSGELSAQQERIDSGPIVDRIRETVFTLNGYVSEMVGECQNQDRTACYHNRIHCRKAALILFVGGGESYEVDGVHKDPVRMETAFISPSGTKSIKSQFMKVYFNKLIGLVSGDNTRYTKVSITSSEYVVIYLGSLHKIEDNLYECVCTFGEWVYGEHGEIVVYKNYTQKNVKCYVSIVETDAAKEYKILLGDMKCIESHKL